MYMGVTSFKLFAAIQFFARFLSDSFHNTSTLSRIDNDEFICANVLFSIGEIIGQTIKLLISIPLNQNSLNKGENCYV